ncbi:MAG: glycosyltransferase [bacterium]
MFDLEKLLNIKTKIAKSSNFAPIDIIFLTYERLDYFVKTINNLILNTKYPYRIIIVDNNSGVEFKEFLQNNRLLFDEIIFNTKNEWTEAFQKGIDKSRSDPFIVSDPDIIVPKLEGKCWLESVIDLHNLYDDIGLLALNLDNSNLPPKLSDVYLGTKEIYNNEITLSNVGTVFQSIKRKYFNFNYVTDWETCERIRRNGGKVGFTKNIIAYHIGWNEETDYPNYIIDKYEYFKEHYGVDTYLLYLTDEKLISKIRGRTDQYYNNSRPEIQKMVSQKAKKILDVGCAAGHLGYELKKQLGAEVWGIEIVEDVANKAAKKIDFVINLAVENAIEKLPDNYFDTIIFADVLEHLVNPEFVLEQIKSKLKDDGELIISIPNVLHWSVLLGLFNGKWEYQDAGILDKTHLRFFTKSSMIQMLNKIGYKVYYAFPTLLQQSFTFPVSFYNSLEEMGINNSTIKEETNFYQFVFKVFKTEFVEVSIIIPFYNQSENTLLTVHSILNHTKALVEIILIDNGSTEEENRIVAESIKNYEVVTIIKNETNLGFPKAVNQGILLSKGKHIIIANNDLIVTDGSIERMLQLAEIENVGIVGSLTNKGSGLQIDPKAKYNSLEEMTLYAESIKKKNHLQYLEYPRIAFIFVLIKREVIETIGGLDERFSPGNYEDDDFCLRSFLSGFKAVIAFDVFIHHFGSKSFLLDGINKYKQLLDINKQKFISKWGDSAEEIWKTGIVPKSRSLEYALNADHGTHFLLRALDNISNEEYDLAKENIDKVFEISKEKNLESINSVKLEELEKLRIQIYEKVQKK